MKSITSVFKDPVKYNNVTATFVTTQGEITFYLYPEAAPITVANFINLAKRGFYDNTKFNRSVENFMVQGGDPTGTGMGGTGYVIPDEFVEWLDFYQPGMLAMANAGPNTGGSQFFFTFSPADWLNGVHTVFGEVRSEGDFQKIRKLEMGDVVKEVKISENDDGTYTAKIPVTEYRFDCNRHIRADVTTYTITFTPDGEVLNLTSKKVKG